MPPQLIPLSVACGMALAGVAVSFVTLSRAKSLLRKVQRDSSESKPQYESAVEILQKSVESVQAQLQDMRQQGPVMAFASPPPRTGLNLEKRSHALRMHRRGESTAQIAAVLEIPLQEVELLLKVHTIVLRSI
jgi:hypothetical protein